MKTPRNFALGLGLSLAVGLPTSLLGELPEGSLVKNGDFEDAEKLGWALTTGGTVEEEEGNKFLRLTPPEVGKQVQAHQRIPLDGSATKLKLTFKARFTEIVRGSENWHEAKFIAHLKDPDGKTLKPAPKTPTFRGTSEGWQEFEVEMEVPAEASALELMPVLLQVDSGTLEVDDIAVVPVS